MPESKPLLPVIAGPTASGKTGLAVELALRLNGEVVSADSMQVYAGLQIGTARPTPAEMRGVPHHLVGFLPLTEKYSVARYAEDARRAMADIRARGRLPILCGGTGLYVDAVADNLRFAGRGEDPVLREKLSRRADEEGTEALLEELRAVDPETARRLHPSNRGRIVRALELYRTTGMTMSEQLRFSRGVPPPFEARVVVLDSRDRAFLYDRINRRVDGMLAAGLLEEAERALSAPTAPTALQAIGYKELAPYFAGGLSLAEAVENLKRSTRRYAKRQLTWFRRRKDARFLYIDDYDGLPALADAAQAALAAPPPA
ncbi:MAG TPA: tRNA (adenosine(37)-N6)-dimethylallyltransferase MiaA [Firmicutes bacterium]|nr:tRNA (adenosine(37)-N6)-dimethylallyltransferase MiaA [Bacillota bacterium]